MGFMRAMFYFWKADDCDIKCLDHMLITVGKSYGLRGVVRQLEFGGSRYFIVIEGWDFHVDRYMSFLELSQSAVGTVTRVRKVPVPFYSNMRFPDRFIFVLGKRDADKTVAAARKRKQ